MTSSRIRRADNAQQLAEQLLNEFATGEDDAGVVVVRWDACSIFLGIIRFNCFIHNISINYMINGGSMFK